MTTIRPACGIERSFCNSSTPSISGSQSAIIRRSFVDQPYRSVPQCGHATNIPTNRFVEPVSTTSPEHSVHMLAKRGAMLRFPSAISLSWRIRISGGNFCLREIRKNSSSGGLLLESSSRLFKSRSVCTRSIRSALNSGPFTSPTCRLELIWSCGRADFWGARPPMGPSNVAFQLNFFSAAGDGVGGAVGRFFFRQIHKRAAVYTNI